MYELQPCCDFYHSKVLHASHWALKKQSPVIYQVLSTSLVSLKLVHFDNCEAMAVDLSRETLVYLLGTGMANVYSVEISVGMCTVNFLCWTALGPLKLSFI